VRSAGGAIDAAIVDIVIPNMGANELLPAHESQAAEGKGPVDQWVERERSAAAVRRYPGAKFMQNPYTAQRIAQAVADLIGVREAR